MNRIALFAFFLSAVGLLHAQEASPTPIQILEISANDPLAASNAPPKANPKMDKEVDLTKTANAPDPFAIEPPTDIPHPDKIPELTGPLPDEDDQPALPAINGTVEITAKDNTHIITAQVGNLIRIILESNPSAGYNWELYDFKFGIAVFHSSELVPRDTGNVLFGAPGDTVVTLQAIEQGSQTIALIYRRPWEPVDQAVAHFAFRLEVIKPAETPAPPPTTSPLPTP